MGLEGSEGHEYQIIVIAGVRTQVTTGVPFPESLADGVDRMVLSPEEIFQGL